MPKKVAPTATSKSTSPSTSGVPRGKGLTSIRATGKSPNAAPVKGAQPSTPPGRPPRASRAASDAPMLRRTAKISEVIAREIVHDIVDRQLVPGDRLPPEHVMLERYGVGRASLREALRVLEMQGLISIRPGPGGGPVVSATDTFGLGRIFTFHFHLAGATFRELVEARLTMEPVMARFAAERRDPEMLERLRQSIELVDKENGADDTTYLRGATDFHAVIAAASGNRVLDLFGRAIKDIHVDRMSGSVYPEEERARVHSAHEAIMKAVQRGDAKNAERLMREHMVEFVKFTEQRYPGVLDERVDWR